MKVLHIAGSKIEPSNGIGRLLPEMIIMQNRYGTALECALLCANNDGFSSEDFRVISNGIMSNDVFDEFDLFVFHGVYFYKYIGLAKKILARGKRYLVKPHSSLILDAQKKSILKKTLANFLFFKKFIQRAGAIIFTNEDEGNNSVQWNSNLIYEGNGITSVQTVNEKIRDKRKPYKFVYLSRIDFSHKGTDILLDALLSLKTNSRIENINLSIYGKGSAVEESKLIKRISGLGFSGVSFNGPIYGKEKNDMLHEKDIFILTSRYEGFPMAILEALDSGLPCLVTRGVNMTSIINRYNVGWECSTDPDDVANLLLEVMDADEEMINKMSVSAREYVVQAHSWPSLVKYSESIYLNFDKRLM